MTEREFQRAVVELARLMGWRVHHTRPALTRAGEWRTPIQGDAGFPDLVLCRPPRLILAELKRLVRLRDREITEAPHAVVGVQPSASGVVIGEALSCLCVERAYRPIVPLPIGLLEFAEAHFGFAVVPVALAGSALWLTVEVGIHLDALEHFGEDLRQRFASCHALEPPVKLCELLSAQRADMLHAIAL